ncbi:MAG TPA: 23S rRNA (uracil(1939)-C(5))-methyltransferase RlmD [Candidatus Limnocylindria bacterium]|nr:23S rRNA (uracil(1939)-C(5))-methyltransferase RlmD [Candidatus Limnocylindria bacterium]
MVAIEINIEKLIYGGEGLAHHNGSTVFVPFVLPGERVRAAPVEEKKKFIRARLEHVLDPSPARIVSRCPHFTVCGGCDYQHIPYEAQLTYKSEILRETLRRLGRIDWAGTITTHASPPWSYRNRTQWKVRPLEADSVDAEKARLGIGYFRANSTALCAVEDCSILSPLLLKTLLSLREALAAGALPRQLREIEAFSDATDSKLLLTATFAGFSSRIAQVAEKFHAVVPEIESVLLHDPSHERMELSGPGFLTYNAGGIGYRVGHFSFFQVNKFLVEELAREVVEREEPGKLALDLFAGVGLFSAPLVKRFEHVIAVEANPAAARDLEANVAGMRSVEVRTSEVERFLDRCKEKPDLVVLDPPRAGMEPAALAKLARLSPPRITYVSCEPPTLARDLAVLLEKSYDISEVHLFDLFPQTFHMEAVVRLRRRE